MQAPQGAIAINDQIALGGQLTAEQFRELAAAGFKSVIDLRTGDEPEPPLSIEKETDEAQALGLMYVNLPVQGHDIKEGQIERFGELLHEMSAPVYVHCQKGQRAAAVSLLHLSRKHDWSSEDALAKAEQLGCPISSPAMRQAFAELAGAK
jgi:uncharacterized protein (TIGR01244 family)